MPVIQLLVEGNLDAEVLDPIIGAGITVVNTRGSKNALAPRAREDWRNGLRGTRYVRDRDFDFEPPADHLTPTPDRLEGGEPLGWRWSRHSIENYLIDPVIVDAATGWPKAEYEPLLVQSALSIRYYEIARWIVGTVRQGLPPQYRLTTSPETCPSAEIEIPSDVSEETSLNWARMHLQSYFVRLSIGFQSSEIARLETKFSEQLSAEAFAESERVLTWCSGKDLLAGMRTSVQARGYASPKEFVNAVRDWIRENPERTLAGLPEWRSFVAILAEIQ